MTRRKAPLHINQFIGGLNTETNPLENNIQTSKDELNMELNSDGSRSKRSGFNLEENFTEIDTMVTYQQNSLLASTTFRWKNAGGDPSKSLLVVQVAASMHVFDLDNTPISGGLIYSETFDTDTYGNSYSYEVLDGILVMCNGEKQIKIYEYDNGVVTKTEKSLLIRDLFGVEAVAGSDTLTEPNNQQIRPTSLPDEHLYNLRNQTYAAQFRRNNDETVQDTIRSFFLESGSAEYPSNSDSTIPFLFADTSDTDSRQATRFFVNDMFNSPIGSTPAPKGYFKIDALSRGTSRLEQIQAYEARKTPFYSITSLPDDETPGGPKTVGGYAGRFWFSGFNSEVVDGDNQSPKLSSYLLFSQVLIDKNTINKCYQEADPTSRYDNSIADTDGGFIRLDGAYDINHMEESAGTLFVFARNGIWTVSGAESQFSATSYRVSQISKQGCIAPDSVVIADDILYYWGESGIHAIARNEFGIWVVSDITRNTIKSFYNDIDIGRKVACSGYFDNYDRIIKWVYNTSTLPSGSSEELRYQVDFEAFVPYNVNTNNNNLPRIVSLGQTEPFSSTSQFFNVTVNGEDVTANGEDVTTSIQFRSPNLKETVYVAVTKIVPSISFSIGYYYDLDLLDWKELGAGVGYDAYIVSQNLSFGEPRSTKYIPYLYTFFRRTELGFDDSFEALNASSCLLSVHWGWSNSTISNKWSAKRQAYRYTRPYIPVDENDPFNTGFELITTRNKLRGSGKAASFMLEAEAGKNLHIYGWSFEVESSSEV